MFIWKSFFEKNSKTVRFYSRFVSIILIFNILFSSFASIAGAADKVYNFFDVVWQDDPRELMEKDLAEGINGVNGGGVQGGSQTGGQRGSESQAGDNKTGANSANGQENCDSKNGEGKVGVDKASDNKTGDNKNNNDENKRRELVEKIDGLRVEQILDSSTKIFKNIDPICGKGDIGPEVFAPHGGLCGWLGDIEYYKNIKYLLSLKNYGLNEYNDIIGAISYIHEKTNGKPIILFGWCAGAIHSATALINLKKMSPALHSCNLIENADAIKHFNIKGLIFDSGFGSFKDILPKMKEHIENKYLPCLFGEENKTDANNQNQEPKNNPGFITKVSDFITKTFSVAISQAKDIATWFTKIFFNIVFGIGNLLFDRNFEENDAITNIYDKIGDIKDDIHTLFIHSKEDSLAPLRGVQILYDSMNKNNCQFWATEGNHHATNHLKYKEIYKTKLEAWLNIAIGSAPSVSQNRNNNNQNNANSNKEKPAKKLNPNVKRMIEIIDRLIVLFTNMNPNQTSQKTQKEIQDLITEFNTLLNDPKSNIPAPAKSAIEQILAKIPESKSQDEIISKLKEIKNILLNLESIKTAENNGKNGEEKAENDEELGKNNDKNDNNNSAKNNEYDRYKDNKPSTVYNNPSSNSSGNSPSNYGSNYGNRGYGPSSNGTNGSNYGPNGSSQRGPGSGRHSGGNMHGGNGSGYGGYGNYNGPGMPNKDDEKNKVLRPVLTEAEYLLMDHDEPELEDEPDCGMPFWMRMNSRA